MLNHGGNPSRDFHGTRRQALRPGAGIPSNDPQMRVRNLREYAGPNLSTEILNSINVGFPVHSADKQNQGSLLFRLRAWSELFRIYPSRHHADSPGIGPFAHQSLI